MKKIIIYLTCVVCIFLIFSPGYYVLPKTRINFGIQSHHKNPTYNDVIVYLINLDRSSARLEYMLPKIQSLPFAFQRISAIDGKTLSPQELKTKFDLQGYYRFMGKFEPIGAFGCSLSHIKTWETFLKSDYEFALILEDDIDFDPMLLTNTINQLIKHKEYWDITTLHHGNSYTINNTSKGTPINILQFSENNLSFFLTKTTCTIAYIISRDAAEKLLAKSLPIKMPVDLYFNRGWELELKFAGINPQLVFAKNDRPHSQIANTNVISLPEAHISTTDYYLAPLTAKFYKYHTALARLFHNLKLLCWAKLKLRGII